MAWHTKEVAFSEFNYVEPTDQSKLTGLLELCIAMGEGEEEKYLHYH